MRFTFNEAAWAAWNVGDALGIPAEEQAETLRQWDPTTYGNESEILQLVEEAQRNGVIVAPAGMTVHYSYSDDTDGGGYLWTLDLVRGEGADAARVRLASNWEEQRKVVSPRETRGRAAMELILREAANTANWLLRDLDRYNRDEVLDLMHAAAEWALNDEGLTLSSDREPGLVEMLREAMAKKEARTDG